MIYEGFKIIYAFIKKDGRVIIIIRKGNKKNTISYAKYIYGSYHEGITFKEMTVHHADFNKFNNDPENLVLISQKEHNDLHELAGLNFEGYPVDSIYECIKIIEQGYKFKKLLGYDNGSEGDFRLALFVKSCFPDLLVRYTLSVAEAIKLDIG